MAPDMREKARLQIAGLGEKSITLDKFGDGCDVHDALMYRFPKLQNGGGYEVLRIFDASTKELEIIPAPQKDIV